MAARRQPPSIRLRRLAGELKRLRATAEYTREFVSERTLINMASLYRIETAQVRPQRRTLLALLDCYGVEDQGQRDAMIELLRSASPPAGGRRHDSDLLDSYQTFICFEAEASRVLTYESLYVPGLLQTERYARTIVQGVLWSASAEYAERRVEIRMRRQELLAKENQLTLWAVIDEAVLRRNVGGADVMAEQLSRLSQMAHESHVTIQVIPFGAGAHPGMSGPFVVMDFPDPADPTIVWAESAAGDRFVDDEAEVRRHCTSFQQVTAQALSPADSLRLIEAVIAEGWK